MASFLSHLVFGSLSPKEKIWSCRKKLLAFVALFLKEGSHGLNCLSFRALFSEMIARIQGDIFSRGVITSSPGNHLLPYSFSY